MLVGTQRKKKILKLPSAFHSPNSFDPSLNLVGRASVSVLE